MTYFLTASDPDFYQQLTHILNDKREMSEEVGDIVTSIIKDVIARGDEALGEYTQKFDHFSPHNIPLKLTQSEIKDAYKNVSDEEIVALKQAIQRIRDFHEKQKPEGFAYEDEIGVKLGMRWGAIDAVGLYVPGGIASYPSSVLMNAIPALVAGVKRIAMVVPAPEGKINPLVLVAADLLGIDEIYRIGGAQAVAALAYGTEMIKPVDKIVGPGNAFVANAKRQVFGQVGIDMIAGPSEVLIIADDSASTSWIAADLLAQAEHDESAQSIVVTTSQRIVEDIDKEVKRQLNTLPKAKIAGKSWAENGVVILAKDEKQAAEISNQFAPEHLELMLKNPHALLDDIHHAGAIFIGQHTPEAIGDYIGGPNHVLPTARSARFSSGLSVFDFLKRTTLLECGPEQLKTLSKSAMTLARSEDLMAHHDSIKIRVN